MTQGATDPRDPPVQEGASELVVCKLHGLRYNPAINIGCVVCRREPAAPEVAVDSRLGGWLVSGLIVAGVTGSIFYFGTRALDARKVRTPAAMISGSSTKHAECYETCADTHSTCHERCASHAQAQGCRDLCFKEAAPCFGKCESRFEKPQPPWSYYYGSGDMPEWSVVLESANEVPQRLLPCADDPLAVLTHVSVAANGGTPQQVSVWRGELGAAAHQCAIDAIRRTAFPKAQSDYSFVAAFDSRFDGLALLRAQIEAELKALPRRNGEEGAQEALTSRLFDVKVRMEEQAKQGPPPEEAQLATAEGEARDLKRLLASELSALRPNVRYPTPAQAPSTKSAESANKRAAELEEKTRRETERYRSINREYRRREDEARWRRDWQSRWEH